MIASSSLFNAAFLFSSFKCVFALIIHDNM
jgi:hypothetical protein